MFLINKIPKNLMYFLALVSELHHYFTKAEAQGLKKKKNLNFNLLFSISIGEISAALEQELHGCSSDDF